MIAAGLAFGFSLRFPGFDGRALWVDELWRTNLILQSDIFRRYFTAPDVYTAITAPGYVGLNWLLTAWHVSVETLRLSSLAPALLSIVFAGALAWRVNAGPALTALTVVMFASNIDFIAYSNEFKPYMFEVLLHLVSFYVWVGLIMSGPRAPQQFVVFFSVLTLAALSTANFVFIFPALAVSVLLDAWLRPGREGLIPATAGFSAISVMLGAMYILIWSHGSDDDLRHYWSEGFYDPTGENYPQFVLQTSWAMWQATFTFAGGVTAGSLALIATLAALVLVVVDRLPRIGRRFLGFTVFYVTLFATLWVLNALRLWPLGQLRPNLFIYGHLLAFSVVLLAAASATGGEIGRRAISAAAMGATTLLLIGVIDTDMRYLRNYGPPVEQTDLVLSDFVDGGGMGSPIVPPCRQPKATLFVTGFMSLAVDYYTTLDDHGRLRYALLTSDCFDVVRTAEAYQNPAQVREEIAAHIGTDQQLWFLYSHLSDAEAQSLKLVAGIFGKVSNERAYTGAGYFRIARP